MKERIPVQVVHLSHLRSRDADLTIVPTVFGRSLSHAMHDLLRTHAVCMRCRRPTTVLVEHERCLSSAGGMLFRVPREYVSAIEAEFELERRRDVNYQAIIRRRAELRDAGGSHSRADLRKLYEFQRAKCFYCLRSLGTLRGDDVVLAKDHFLPVSRGGGNDIRNIVLACPRCNSEKSDGDGEKFCRLSIRRSSPEDRPILRAMHLARTVGLATLFVSAAVSP